MKRSLMFTSCLLVACSTPDLRAEEWRNLLEIGLAAHRDFEYELAEAKLLQALDVARESDAPVAEVSRIRDALAEMYEHSSRFDLAEATYRQNLREVTSALGEDHPAVADTLLGLASVIFLEDPQEFGKMMRRALEIRRGALGPHHPSTVYALILWGLYLEGRDELTAAEAAFREAIEAVTDCREAVPELFGALVALQQLLRREGRIAEADRLEPRFEALNGLPLDRTEPAEACERNDPQPE